MHTRNVNVKTAAQESTGRCDSNLTTSQFTDLFCWVLAASEGEPQPVIFTPPENATELTLINDECPDYISVWVVDGRPVAAAIPLDNFHRVISSSLTKEGANKQVISSQADSLIKISRIWADFFPANTSNQPI
ncbi:hypothetical protein [Enterobacter roggenkampii]|uniref:hypothetical protein n=1 Tax=Enterobacter roggenkampii TaxID=1812935 RepID=UPI0020053D79|nr:hypothetical protein [Enterobacter roggenkampii]MCK7203898.1 hypothetical protein [Enterobacter roggenkampii]